jgi:2-polyprenyl-3-methyl-5-hydroxy-6-metoxy-1,4-benzoquinol methylase
MPTSDFHSINAILALITQLNPNSVLDIGCGFGKYGVLLREYLDVWHQRLVAKQWQVELVGIEAHKGYLNPVHDFVYSKVHCGEAQQVLPKLGQFDVVLIADVIEHLEKDEASELVQECLRHSPVVIISTPVAFYPQGEVLENPYEVHRNRWDRDDFPPGVTVRTIRIVSCFIFVASRQPLEGRVFSLTDPIDYVYLRSRYKLGKLGLPLSLGLRCLCRLLS